MQHNLNLIRYKQGTVVAGSNYVAVFRSRKKKLTSFLTGWSWISIAILNEIKKLPGKLEGISFG